MPLWHASRMACRRAPGGSGFTIHLFSSSSVIFPPAAGNHMHVQWAPWCGDGQRRMTNHDDVNSA